MSIQIERKSSVTGRDQHIVCNALAYAITTIECLPERWQEASDCEDMKALLLAIADDWYDMYVAGARHHIDGAAKELS